MVEHVVEAGSTRFAPESIEAKPDVGPEGFFAVEMRVGRVLAVEPFPEMRKPSLKVQVDFGPRGVLWTSAQIADHDPAALRGRLVVGAVNLGERRLPTGFMSQFLLLGGLHPDGRVGLLSVPEDLPLGAIVG